MLISHWQSSITHRGQIQSWWNLRSMPWCRCSSVRLLGHVIGATLCDHLWVGFSRTKLTTPRYLCRFQSVTKCIYRSLYGAIALREIRLSLCTQNCHPDFGASIVDQICRATLIHVAGWVTSCPCMISHLRKIANLPLPFRETQFTHMSINRTSCNTSQ